MKASGQNKVIIDYLYLDLNKCDRCIGTDEVLEEVIKTLTPALKLAGYEIVLNKTEMATAEIAAQYMFESSPTIRVNGKDICLSIDENRCGCCSDIVGCDIDCRVFEYNGKIYEVLPKEMLADAILQTVFSKDKTNHNNYEYIMPKNLIEFYKNKKFKENINMENTKMKTISIFEPAMCCETGLCGVGVNPELMRISTVLDNLKKNGIAVTRYNLSNAPQQFLKNQEINKILNEKGPKVLPITMIDGKIEITGRYPTNGEIVMLLNISPDFLNATQKSGGCCSDNENKSSGCCNGNENKSGGCC